VLIQICRLVLKAVFERTFDDVGGHLKPISLFQDFSKPTRFIAIFWIFPYFCDQLR
jgi:hypothetical protein